MLIISETFNLLAVMKNIMKSIMLFAVAAMAFTSCTKESVNEAVKPNDTYTMKFVADAPETRTSVEVDGTTANFSWAVEGETFTFIQNTAEGGLKKGTDVTFANNAGLAEITATFTEATSPIVAVYPENAWVSDDNTNFNKAKLIVPRDQSILDGTFDPNADLLVSKVVTPENTTDTHKLQFARLVAVGKMTLKNLPVVGTETIQRVNFSIDSENALTGRLYIDLETAEVSEWGYYGQALNYVNLIDGNVTAAAANDFYFTCMPATVAAGETFTIEVTTDTATYTHSVTIPDGKFIEFKSGRVAEFGVNMATAERVTIEGLPLPWSESFDSDDLSKYDITSGGSTTKWYNEQLAGGTAGEILISKGGGSMTATLASDGEAKTLNLWFKSNKTFIEVSSATEGVTINKLTSYSYTVKLDEGIRTFKITLTNNNSGTNARVDDIVLTAEAPTVEKITVTGATTSFTVGDTFVFDGTVTATYNNGATENVTDDVTVDSSEVKMDTAGTYTVTVTYNGKNATYNVTVAEESVDGGGVTMVATFAPRKVTATNTTFTDDQGNNWTFTSDAAGFTSSTSYVHAGSNSKAVSHITFESTIEDVTSVTVNAAAKANTNVTIKVYIGSTLIGTSNVLGATQGNGGTAFTVENTQNATGTLKIVVSRPSSVKGAIYFNQAVVNYTN